MSNTTTAVEWADEARTLLRLPDAAVVGVRRLLLEGLVSDVASRDTLIDSMREEGCAAVGALERAFIIATADGAPPKESPLGRIADLASGVLVTAERCKHHALIDELVAALRELRDKAKWAWQFISAVALDGHNREHDGRRVALAECQEAPCPMWREDLQSYQDAIAAAEQALRRVEEVRHE